MIELANDNAALLGDKLNNSVSLMNDGNLCLNGDVVLSSGDDIPSILDNFCFPSCF